MDEVEAFFDASHTLLAELLHLEVASQTAQLAAVLRLSFGGGLPPPLLPVSQPDRPEAKQDSRVAIALRGASLVGDVEAEVTAVLLVGHL